MSEGYKRKLKKNAKGEDDPNPVEAAYEAARERWGEGWSKLSYEMKESAVAREALAAISAEVVDPEAQPAVFAMKMFAGAAFRIVHMMDGEGAQDGT
jgi:hypothetical protein